MELFKKGRARVSLLTWRSEVHKEVKKWDKKASFPLMLLLLIVLPTLVEGQKIIQKEAEIFF